MGSMKACAFATTRSGVGVKVLVSVGDSVGVKVCVGVKVGFIVAVGVIVGADNCPRAQPDEARLKIKTKIPKVCCFVFIFPLMLS